MSGFTLDAGALIAFEKGDRRVAAIVRMSLRDEVPITVPAGALAQVWRGGARQAQLARLLAGHGVHIEPLDGRRARDAGQLCGESRTRDVVDTSVVVGARMRGDAILTSDVGELRRLDANIELIAV